VRVLIDDIGAHYSWPTAFGALRRANVRTAAFLPHLLPAYLPYANLRNHRKILIVDGCIGFAGGINIRAGNELGSSPRHPIQDLHFRVDGLVVAQFQEVFADDWHFCTREILDGDCWFPPLEAVGSISARAISSGPDDRFERMRMAFLGALSCARSSVRIVTPYFLPDNGLVAALGTAALRGVQVDILLPRCCNLRLVQWATMATLWQTLEHGCRVWLTPPPFDHSKLMIVDSAWTLLGSANWDPRSLRLNFEFNLECYSRELAASLEEVVRRKMSKARQITLADVDRRPVPIKLRDGVARLFTPYL
jgi:cardiolipin synthase